MATDKESRLAALRSRVQSKLITSRVESRRRKKQTEDEIVVKSPTVSKESEVLEFEAEELTDGERRRRLAATLVMIGALMGMLSGTLILQGNPSELLESTLFSTNDAIDVHGFLLDQDGDPVEGVAAQLIDPETGSVINENYSDSNGRFVIRNVAVTEYELHVSKTGYKTVILKFVPEPIGISPITMELGDGERVVDERTTSGGWSMENAVALATIEGLFTIGCALVGVHASFEIRRKKAYRRTQKLCWVALFSRGLILFGPALILIGMILIMLNKEDFEDQNTSTSVDLQGES